MITVKLNRKAETLSLCVTGHAGFAAMGQDIVCAAASILVYTAAELALDMARRGQLRQPPVLKPSFSAAPKSPSPSRCIISKETSLTQPRF